MIATDSRTGTVLLLVLLLCFAACPKPDSIATGCKLTIDVVGKPMQEAIETLKGAGLREGAMGYGCWDSGTWWCAKMCVARITQVDDREVVRNVLSEVALDCGPSDLWVPDDFGDCRVGVFAN